MLFASPGCVDLFLFVLFSIFHHVNVCRKDFQLRLGTARLALLAGNGSNHVGLDDIDTRVQADFKSKLLGLLAGNHLRVRLHGLFVNERPEAVVALMQKLGQRGDDKDTVAVLRHVDDARLLEVLGVGVDGTHVGLGELQHRMGLDGKSRDECIADAYCMD